MMGNQEFHVVAQLVIVNGQTFNSFDKKPMSLAWYNLSQP